METTQNTNNTTRQVFIQQSKWVNGFYYDHLYQPVVTILSHLLWSTGALDMVYSAAWNAEDRNKFSLNYWSTQHFHETDDAEYAFPLDQCKAAYADLQSIAPQHS